MKTVYLHALGCDKNTVDGEYLLGDFSKAGYKIVKSPEEADTIVINTCAFIKEAKEESIEAIFSYLGSDKQIIVTGCLAERYRDELAEEIPEIDYLIGLKERDKLLEILGSSGKESRYLENSPSAYLKIADGCNRRCSFCAIPTIRGEHKSKSLESILEEARALKKRGVKELILVSQDLTQYGYDIDVRLIDLLEALEEVGFDWIRMLYLYPEGITDELLMYIKNRKDILPYFDIPIQHTSDHILSLMGRRLNRDQIFKKVSRIREILPEAVIRSTVIVGFPGESEADFNTLLKDLKTLKFDRLGAFSYSREENTRAYHFSDQVSEEIKKERQNRVICEESEIIRESNKRFIGRVYDTLVEEKIDENTYCGRFYADSPEIDCIVYINAEENLEIGSIVSVLIEDALDFEFMGKHYESTE